MISSELHGASQWVDAGGRMEEEVSSVLFWRQMQEAVLCWIYLHPLPPLFPLLVLPVHTVFCPASAVPSPFCSPPSIFTSVPLFSVFLPFFSLIICQFLLLHHLFSLFPVILCRFFLVCPSCVSRCRLFLGASPQCSTKILHPPSCFFSLFIVLAF